jgi:hypothetical protein
MRTKRILMGLLMGTKKNLMRTIWELDENNENLMGIQPPTPSKKLRIYLLVNCFVIKNGQ